MLGGLAVVGHGLSRSTFDIDVWLDPDLPLGDWCDVVCSIVAGKSYLRIVSIGNWENVPAGNFPEVVSHDGVIRITGANQPLDIFRKPNQLDPAEFNDIWSRSRILDDGTRLPDPIDLLVSKQETGRDKDQTDIMFLEGKIQADYLSRLPKASRDEAVLMLERFLTPRVAEAALAHADQAVRDLGLRFLRELAQEGDPFAAEILRKIGE